MADCGLRRRPHPAPSREDAGGAFAAYITGNVASNAGTINNNTGATWVGNATSAGTLNNDGTWTFTPAEDFNGTVNLSYGVSDGTLTTPATATVTVAGVR